MIIARDISHLVKVNQLHSDFVANVSHELKTPLTVLRGYLEILSDSPAFPEKFRKPVEQMNAQSSRMQLIVNDLLFLAKLEDKHSRPDYQYINVTNLFNTIIESVQPLISDKQQKLELDIDYQLEVKGEQTELHSAFLNLITNAINYTPKNGLIKVRWKKQQGRPVFSVKDNGIGIADRHLNRITQRFYRVDDDRSRERGGTGLGLAIVKHVVQRHGADFVIESEQGVGSKFSCVFEPVETLEPRLTKERA